MRLFGKLLKWLGLGLVLLIVILLAPVAYNEVACRGQSAATAYEPQLPSDHHRLEARTFLTYPEWHIVHAYDDYAKVIQTGDPHAYGFLSGISGFWSSLCALSEQSAAHGGFDWPTKQTIYTIGVSFSLELAFKALYEETIGRIATLIRGAERAPLDDLSAQQAASYARFLQQTPWYRWDFSSDIDALSAANSAVFRDKERRFALGLEFGAKAKYADVITAAVATMEPDALSLRMIVTNVDAQTLRSYPDIVLIEERGPSFEIETPRYRQLTELLQRLANDGADVVEIAGNDDIMFTAISNQAFEPALHSFERQGYGDNRHLIAVKVRDLAERLRTLGDEGLTLEHIHDY